MDGLRTLLLKFKSFLMAFAVVVASLSALDLCNYSLLWPWPDEPFGKALGIPLRLTSLLPLGAAGVCCFTDAFRSDAGLLTDVGLCCTYLALYVLAWGFFAWDKQTFAVSVWTPTYSLYFTPKPPNFWNNCRSCDVFEALSGWGGTSGRCCCTRACSSSCTGPRPTRARWSRASPPSASASPRSSPSGASTSSRARPEGRGGEKGLLEETC